MIFFCLSWVSWCVLHSLLIDAAIAGFLKKKLSKLNRYYRLCYNLISVVTLVPLIILTGREGGALIIQWSGFMHLPRFFLLICSALLFYEGAKQYDLGYFLGVEQMKTGEDHLLLGDDEAFSDEGVLGVTRHPWYLGGICLLWSAFSTYDAKRFSVACILSIYFWIGSFLEERKIVAQYGDSYEAYRNRVSMLFPWKWLFARIRFGR